MPSIKTLLLNILIILFVSKIDTSANKGAITYPKNCEEATIGASGVAGLHIIQLPGFNMEPFYVYCEVDPHGGPAWAVLQRRIDGSVNFFRPWNEYVYGFGNVGGEFFLGLEKLHAMTISTPHELWIHLGDYKLYQRNAYYKQFAIGDANQMYALVVLGNYSGDAGDSLSYHAGQKFSTVDADNDGSLIYNCATSLESAWWFNACRNSSLNGPYRPKRSYSGIVWQSWHGEDYTLKYAHMAIRPVYVPED